GTRVPRRCWRLPRPPASRSRTSTTTTAQTSRSSGCAGWASRSTRAIRRRRTSTTVSATATSPSASDRRLGRLPEALRFVAGGNPESQRIRGFQSALARFRLPPAEVVPYLDLIAGRRTLGEVVRPGTVVRIESPDQDFEVERAILAMGAAAAEAEGT